MARSFSAQDAKKLLQAHRSLRDRLQDSLSLPAKGREAVSQAAEKYITAEVMKTLREVPVEELGREKQGIRVKLLRDHGYDNLARLAAATEAELVSINGIGPEGARTIQSACRERILQARKLTKIRLSSDHKTRETGSLVYALSLYRQMLPATQALTRFAETAENGVRPLLADLEPATRSLGWLFVPREKKDKAERAYDTLSQLINGSYGQGARAAFQELSRLFQESSTQSAWQDFEAHSIQFYNTLEELVPGLLGDGDGLYGLPEDLAREIQDEAFFPAGLNCELRRYQEWGVKYILHQERVLLGDEMGLGKTVQAIAAMVSLKNTGATHFLVVCPASVLTNWIREIRSKSKLNVTRVHGEDRKAAFDSWLQSGGVAVTTYESSGSLIPPEDFKFSLLVADEAHYIKNPAAQRSRNVKTLCGFAERLLFMTGTALENRVEEMISLIKLLQPRVAARVEGMEFMAQAPQFRLEVAPVYYRRRREDVLTELPDMIESKEWCDLEPEEEAVYEADILEGRYARARRVSWTAPDISCSSKARRMLELVEEAAREGRKILVFTFFLETLARIRELLGERCLEPINGSVPPARRQAIIDEFDKAPAGTVLAAQITSGGTGLNIQSASVVILCEPQFKPSTENQAISRAYRMGQTRNVLVFRLLADETIDEKITDLLAEKQALFDAFADTSEAARQSLELDDKGFNNLIQEEIERIKSKQGASHEDLHHQQ